ncbi:MAG: prepilin-type N-terminal cleavage/methylation domain-containing protein [Candidatus Margulisiibacteriota bacterium]
MRNKGFVLIELVVIMIIIGILAVFAMVALNPYREVKLDAAAQKVVADLLYTRNLALSTAKWYGVSFEVDPINTYTIYQTDGTTDTVIENPSQLGKDFIVDLYDYYSGVTINSVNIGGGNKLEFHPLGTPYNDKNGSAETVTGLVTIEYSGLTKTIQITPNTGRTTVQ